MKSLKGFINRIQSYILNPDVNMTEKSYMVFSTVVLIALFVAVPCGLIMREPFIATIYFVRCYSIYYLCLRFL